MILYREIEDIHQRMLEKTPTRVTLLRMRSGLVSFASWWLILPVVNLPHKASLELSTAFGSAIAHCR